MTAKERFNAMIGKIEVGAQDKSISDIEIASEAKKLSGFGDRDINAVMNYLVGDTLLNYIRERKMMAAYRYLISDKSKISEAISYADPEKYTHSSFDKVFKRVFGVTPKEAQDTKDRSLLTEPSTWEMISGEVESFNETASDSVHTIPSVTEHKTGTAVQYEETLADQSEEKSVFCTTTENFGDEVERMKENMIFGIPESQYDLVLKATELQALYGLDAMFAAVAFELYQTGRQLESAFKFVDELHSYGFGLPNEWAEHEETAKELEIKLREYAFDEKIQYLYFECGTSVAGAIEILEELPIRPDEIYELDPRLLREFSRRDEIGPYVEERYFTDGSYPTEVINYRFFKNAFEYYMFRSKGELDDDHFKKYMYFSYEGMYKEEAYEYAYYATAFADCDGYEDDPGDKYYSNDFPEPFEKEMEENSRWMGTSIDEEYDIDNMPEGSYDDMIDPCE